MGGKQTPAIGFAIGLERLIILAGKEFEEKKETDVYIVNNGFSAESIAIEISRKLRNYELITELDVSGSSFSKQFKKANKLKAKSIIVLGDEEASNNEFVIRLFNKDSSETKEEKISFDNDIKLEKWLNNNLFLK